MTCPSCLGADDARAQLFVIAQGLAYAFTLVVTGRLGDLFDHRSIPPDPG